MAAFTFKTSVYSFTSPRSEPIYMNLGILFAVNFCDVSNISESKIEISENFDFFSITKKALYLSPDIRVIDGRRGWSEKKQKMIMMIGCLRNWAIIRTGGKNPFELTISSLNRSKKTFCRKITAREKTFFLYFSDFIEITLWHRCSPVSLMHIFRTLFMKNTSGWLLLSLPITISVFLINKRWMRYSKIY